MAPIGVTDPGIFFSGQRPLRRSLQLFKAIRIAIRGSSDLDLDVNEKARTPAGALHVIRHAGPPPVRMTHASVARDGCMHTSMNNA